MASSVFCIPRVIDRFGPSRPPRWSDLGSLAAFQVGFLARILKEFVLRPERAKVQMCFPACGSRELLAAPPGPNASAFSLLESWISKKQTCCNVEF